MPTIDIATLADADIVEALMRRDPYVTKHYLFKKCYPLFKSIYDRYYTDCSSCFEFINEIYLFIMVPGKSTGESKLGQFAGRCSLTMWLKIVAQNYCRQLFAKKGEFFEESLTDGDRNLPVDLSLEESMLDLDRRDLNRILENMPNERYRRLIEYRYVEEKSNEETALLLGMTMANYYNKHKLAKAQFSEQLRKEGLI
ncbi:MAG: sigma-70 family RNA polymerase sigma factor [Muribaculaceae bacterium]|nr:sigma-70 family RNA polymerase sigma factor [Muribaculaceae bacterium]